jgi:hypothetical protein
MNKVRICFQWHNEHFKSRPSFFSVGKGATNTPLYWELLRDETCSAVEASAKTSVFSYSYGVMIFIAAMPIGFQIANQKTRSRSKL